MKEKVFDFRAEAQEAVQRMMKDMLKAQPERRWISCSERLPEHDGEYLVTRYAGYQPKRMIIDISLYVVNGSKWYKGDPVIAWMPLPEIYREDVNDTISRQAALNACKNPEDGENAYAFGDDIEKRLMALPSAQPEKRTIERTETHACDLISRAAVDAVCPICEYRFQN